MSENLKHKTKVGIYWKFFEQFSTYGMQFVVGIVMARLLSPEDFGTAALPAVFLAIAQVFIDGGFALALIRKTEVSEKDLSTSFYYSLSVGVVLYIIMFFAAPFIASFYETPILESLVRVSSLTFLWGPLNTPQTIILNRKLDFKTPARISIINKIVSGILGISAAYVGYGIWALVIASLSANVIGVIQTWIAVKWLPKEKFSKESFRYLWNFGNKMIATRLLTTLYANIVPVFLGKVSGTADLGKYNRSAQFASLPSANFAGVISNVTFPVLSKLNGDKQKLAHNYRRMIKVSSFIVFPIMMLLCALSKPVILLLITDKWADCIVLLQIMCFTYMFQPIQILNVNLLQIMGRTDLSLKLEIIKKCIFPIVLIIAVQHGLIILCLTDFFITMAALVLNTFYTGKLINVGYLMQVKDFLPSLLLSLISVIPAWLISTYTDISYIYQIITGGILCCSIYFGISILLKMDEIEDVKYMINIKK